MDFKILSIALISGFALSCAKVDNGQKGENIIGTQLSQITPIKSSGGAEKKGIALFDPVVKKIHQFGLQPLELIRTLQPLNPDAKHYVLDSEDANYVVDLSEKHVTVFDKYGFAQHNPIHFVGNPVSAAFRPDLGWLIMYDDLQSVGILKIDGNGTIQKSYVFGSIVEPQASIVAGELLNDGLLALTLSNQKLALVNLEKNFQTTPPQWNAQIIDLSSLGDVVNWIAPVSHQTQRVLMKTRSTLFLYDIPSQSVINQVDIGATDLIKLSKSTDPHVLVKLNSKNLKLYYTDGNSILSLSFFLTENISTILESDLDLNRNTWTALRLSAEFNENFLFNDPNIETTGRKLTQYRVADKLVLANKQIPDRTQVKLSDDFIFLLYPSVLGRAEKSYVTDDRIEKIDQFNLKKY